MLASHTDAGIGGISRALAAAGVSRKNRFEWDAIISCEMIGHYKTRPQAYRTAARWLQLDPSEILMVACHNFDLNAARACGYGNPARRAAERRHPRDRSPGDCRRARRAAQARRR